MLVYKILKQPSQLLVLILCNQFSVYLQCGAVTQEYQCGLRSILGSEQCAYITPHLNHTQRMHFLCFATYPNKLTQELIFPEEGLQQVSRPSRFITVCNCTYIPTSDSSRAGDRQPKSTLPLETTTYAVGLPRSQETCTIIFSGERDTERDPLLSRAFHSLTVLVVVAVDVVIDAAIIIITINITTIALHCREGKGKGSNSDDGNTPRKWSRCWIWRDVNIRHSDEGGIL